MFTKVTPESYAELASRGGRVVVHEEFSSDLLTPIAAMKILKALNLDVILLESGETDEEEGSFSCLGFDPYATLQTQCGKSVITIEGEETVSGDSPFLLLRSLLDAEMAHTAVPLPGFIGGAAGYVSYDAVRHLERIPDAHKCERKKPTFHFQFFKTAICFDHEKNTVTLAVVQKATDSFATAQQAIQRLHKTLHETPVPSPVSKNKRNQSLAMHPDISDKEFAQIVVKAQKHIRKGDAFQIVPSRRFCGKTTADPFDVYRALRHINPSPYMFFFQSGDFAIAGASPELLVSTRGRTVTTMPIAGTTPRGRTPAEDAAAANDLLSDPKEDAEHMMLVDLGRNDLGRVSKRGSVRVTRLKFVRRFSHVMHLVSLVEGTLDTSCDPIDALMATFPAGTLSGAPKVRAMEIIDGLESTPRELYGGAICSFSATGDLTSCIAIRMVSIQDGMATVRAGAGVVYDSVPEREARETSQKAQAVIDAIAAAERGEI